MFGLLAGGTRSRIRSFKVRDGVDCIELDVEQAVSVSCGTNSKHPSFCAARQASVYVFSIPTSFGEGKPKSG